MKFNTRERLDTKKTKKTKGDLFIKAEMENRNKHQVLHHPLLAEGCIEE